MSIVLYVLENEQRRDIWRISETRSKLFLGIAEAAAVVLNVRSGLYTDGSPSWRVEPEEFCALVENVFEHPSELLHPWAQQAAAIYESIKGECFNWQWSIHKLPIEIFKPQRDVDDSPKRFSSKKIGLA